jgi:hypothetical protein
MTYGLPVKTRHDQLAQFAKKAFDDLGTASAPGKYFVNVIPQLRHLPDWFPGTTFKKDGLRVVQHLDKVREETYQGTLNAMVRRVLIDVLIHWVILYLG